MSTLVVAEHEGGFVKPSSLSALAAAEAIAKENKVSVLLGGSGPALHKAADHAASSHPLVSEVLCCRLAPPVHSTDHVFVPQFQFPAFQLSPKEEVDQTRR